MATLLPDAFFAEEANRFGNLIFVREEGVAEATRQAVTAIATCLEKPGGCVVVPGVTGTLWGFSAAAAAVAGVIAGAATSYGRASGEGAAKGLLYASPLWIFALGGCRSFRFSLAGARCRARPTWHSSWRCSRSSRARAILAGRSQATRAIRTTMSGDTAAGPCSVVSLRVLRSFRRCNEKGAALGTSHRVPSLTCYVLSLSLPLPL